MMGRNELQNRSIPGLCESFIVVVITSRQTLVPEFDGFEYDANVKKYLIHLEGQAIEPENPVPLEGVRRL